MVLQFLVVLRNFKAEMNPCASFLQWVNFNDQWTFCAVFCIQLLLCNGKCGVQKVTVCLWEIVVVICGLKIRFLLTWRDHLHWKCTKSSILNQLYGGFLLVYHIIVKDLNWEFRSSGFKVVSNTIRNRNDTTVNIFQKELYLWWDYDFIFLAFVLVRTDHQCDCFFIGVLAWFSDCIGRQLDLISTELRLSLEKIVANGDSEV